MRLLYLPLALPALAVPSLLSAQTISEARVREAVADAARGLGQALAGGSPLSAPSVPTGGLGHFQLGVAGGVTRVEVEDPREEEGALEFFLPIGTLNAAVGLTRGGTAGFGAIDLLARVGPMVAREEYRDSRFLTSVGARIGILGEGAVAPSISATFARSWVDELEYGDPAGDEVTFRGDVRTLSARLDVSKKLVVVTPYAGAGFDRTAIDADYRIPASRSTGGSEIAGGIETSSVHHKAYAGVELALALLSASAETGVYDGGAFASLGLRLTH